MASGSRNNDERIRRLAVIGGGVTGLAAAYALYCREPKSEVVLFEASSRTGGVIQTLESESCLVELGPDMFTTRETGALHLCRQLGIEEQLLSTETRRRGALIAKRGKLHPVPEGLALMAPHQLRSILRTPLLSWRGRMRLVGESLVPRKNTTGDESLESFACRRFGREAYEWLIQPLVSGIYTADPKKLSMNATMSEFLEMERSAGSVIRATLRREREKLRTQAEAADASGARYGLFLAPQGGMEAITKALANALSRDRIRLNSPVRKLKRGHESNCWELHFDEESPTQSFDGVVIAARAPVAGRLISNVSETLDEQLQTIPYASSAVVVMIVPRAQVAHPLAAFGLVIPMAERRQIIAASFSNHKFAGRAPDDRIIIRTFIGGACQPELLNRSDAELLDLARTELVELIGLKSNPHVEFSQVVRWNEAMPQYHLGHRDRVAKIEAMMEELPGCELAGNAYHGVGIPACITSGQQAAERLLAELNEKRPRIS